MTDHEILERLTKIFIDEFEAKPELVRPEATLYQEIELDSLDAIDMIVALENEFGIKVDREKDEQTVRAMRTVADVIDYIKLKMAQ